MARQAISNALKGQPDLTSDPKVQARKAELVKEVQITLQAIRDLSRSTSTDPLTDAQILGQALRQGIMDAPHLKNSKIALGQIRTQVIKGACLTVDAQGKPISEAKRLGQLITKGV